MNTALCVGGPLDGYHIEIFGDHSAVPATAEIVRFHHYLFTTADDGIVTATYDGVHDRP